jgi:AraC-like DNA-binding protein
MSMLPPAIVLRNEKGSADSWVESTLEMLSHESSRRAPGAEAVIARATDILFVQAIRVCLAGADERVRGWLRGLSDARIASALAAIHRRPADPWTVDDLASTAAMSRSAFCERFRGLVGEPPHKYLTRWRIQTAADALHDRETSLAELAERAGFQDEAAFSRAFKRYIGMSPRAYRRSRAPAP